MTPAAPPAIVSFRAVSLSRGGRQVLHDFSLDLLPGQCVVLLGRSGSGKTTALQLVNALLTPSHGQVIVQDRPTTDWDPIRLRRHCGYVMQDTGLFPHYTVARNVATVPHLEAWPEARTTARVAELLDQVGLDPNTYSDRYPHQLSGGQRQRVGVARALAAQPAVLLLDEPFSALDPLTRHELQTLFRRLTRDAGQSSLFVTHDLREALNLGDRILLLDEGRIAVDTDPAGFAASPHPLAALFREASK